MDEFLTTTQAAQALGVSTVRIRQFIGGGRLAAVKMGRDYMIARADLAALERKPVGRPPLPAPPQTDGGTSAA